MRSVQRLTTRIAEEIRAGSLGASGTFFPTQDMLRKKYGVSKSTVVSARKELETQGLVEIAGKTAFITNGRARLDSPYMQNRKVSNSIGVLVPRFESLFFSAFCDEISEWLGKNGYSTLCVACPEGQEYETLKTVNRAGVDGVVATATDRKHIISMYEQIPLPCVLVGARGEQKRLSSIDEDPFDAAKRIAKQLVAEGCTRFLVLRTKKYDISNDRRTNGFLEGLRAEGVFMPQENIIEYEEGMQVNASLRIIINRVRQGKEKTGILLCNIIGLSFFMQQCEAAGLVLHRDMEVASFQDVHKSSQEDLPIIVAKTSVKNLAVSAGKEIIRQISDDTALPQTFKIPYTICWNGINPK